MPIEPNKFLKQANDLLSDDETNCRSAMSRAYYSLYHETKISLENSKTYKGLLIKKIKSDLRRKHKRFDSKLIESYSTQYIKSLRPNFHSILPEVLAKIDKSVAISFNDSKESRQKADYDIDSTTISLSDARVVVDSITKLIPTIDKLVNK